MSPELPSRGAVAAARVFADYCALLMAPRPNKMMYKTDGTTAVTNGAKIVAELMVKHPAAKMFVAMAESQRTHAAMVSQNPPIERRVVARSGSSCRRSAPIDCD